MNALGSLLRPPAIDGHMLLFMGRDESHTQDVAW